MNQQATALSEAVEPFASNHDLHIFRKGTLSYNRNKFLLFYYKYSLYMLDRGIRAFIEQSTEQAVEPLFTGESTSIV